MRWPLCFQLFTLKLTPPSRFGWTGYTPTIHWAIPTVAGIFIGFGLLCVFLPCFNYLVEAYLPV